MIFGNEKQEQHVPATAVTHAASPLNKLIQLRETLLNRLSKITQAPPINQPNTPKPLAAPPVNLAGQIHTTMQQLKAKAISTDGRRVDYAALKEQPAYRHYRQTYLAALRYYDPAQLPTTESARAFWINIYNALVIDAIIHYGVSKSVTEGFIGILTFFRRAAYLIGGQRVSLEDIEHGILRGNRGNPYTPGMHFAASDPRMAWVLPVEPRIHFALNCGGRSCPPVRAYSGDHLDAQLDLAARAYVETAVTINEHETSITLSQIFRWFMADFGGPSGIIQFLIQHLPNGDRRKPFLTVMHDKIQLRFQPYDWRLNNK
ncbi:MAG: DUF547 domain-containing protein [Bacteroidetes bacterium]|nr:MAG: DUF547 domain-containing protein [Bacteroidota bacterium]